MTRLQPRLAYTRKISIHRLPERSTNIARVSCTSTALTGFLYTDFTAVGFVFIHTVRGMRAGTWWYLLFAVTQPSMFSSYPSSQTISIPPRSLYLVNPFSLSRTLSTPRMHHALPRASTMQQHTVYRGMLRVQERRRQSAERDFIIR